jgi:hypothetical protein
VKVLDPQALATWWSRFPELHAGHGRTPPERLSWLRVDASFESEQQSAFAVARAIATWLLVYEEPVLAAVFEHGIWSSSENLYLYYVWRRALGDHGLLKDGPGHLFQKHELSECATLIQLSFLFGWGLSCATCGGERAFHVDHDGHGLLVGRNPDDFAALVPVYLKQT